LASPNLSRTTLTMAVNAAGSPVLDGWVDRSCR
jgi:hypothetical protein